MGEQRVEGDLAFVAGFHFGDHGAFLWRVHVLLDVKGDPDVPDGSVLAVLDPNRADLVVVVVLVEHGENGQELDVPNLDLGSLVHGAEVHPGGQCGGNTLVQRLGERKDVIVRPGDGEAETGRKIPRQTETCPEIRIRNGRGAKKSE